ncbi:hypothetical protein E2C01_069019 [Portunus trituberculatus]|uniref:Uncharacterized protein n=1 Tax=Portunus trituberculatus TaxID=210409 RepID=A0A5B7HQD1_PORTR|nr:hypothetical protein [Portunus trituberculatus]
MLQNVCKRETKTPPPPVYDKEYDEDLAKLRSLVSLCPGRHQGKNTPSLTLLLSFFTFSCLRRLKLHGYSYIFSV